MELVRFEPQNDLEQGLQDARDGIATIDDALARFAAAPIYVPSRGEVAADGSGFDPLLLGEPTKPLVGVFTAPDRLALHRERASWVMQMLGRDLIARTPPGYGLAINPGFDAQLVVEADSLSRLSG